MSPSSLCPRPSPLHSHSCAADRRLAAPVKPARGEPGDSWGAEGAGHQGGQPLLSMEPLAMPPTCLPPPARSLADLPGCVNTIAQFGLFHCLNKNAGLLMKIKCLDMDCSVLQTV